MQDLRLFIMMVICVLATIGIGHYEAFGSKVYWADLEEWKIQRANLDGSTVEDLVNTRPLNHKPNGIALDLTKGKLYWAAFTGSISVQGIYRANLNGSNVEALVTGLSGNPDDIALDLANGKLYWNEFLVPSIGSTIKRANLDIPLGETPATRTDIETLLATPSDVRGPALDVPGKKIYWGESATNASLSDKIRRANLDIPLGETPATRTDIETLVQFPRANTSNIANRIALDLTNRKMYWTVFRNVIGVGQFAKIQRANLNGSNVEELITPLADNNRVFWAIKLDVVGGKMYFSDIDSRVTGLSKIKRANLDGSNVEDIVTVGLREPRGIALLLDIPPIADAGADATVECTSSSGALVSLDGTNSSAPGGDSLTFAWSAPGIVFNDLTSPTPSAIFPRGTTTATLFVTDPDGLSDTDSSDVTVQDTTPPAVSVTIASRSSLWPPHSPISVRVLASDICSAFTITLGGIVLANGEIIKITASPKPGVRLLGTGRDDDERGRSFRHFQVGFGEAVIKATDVAGNIGSVVFQVPQQHGDNDENKKRDDHNRGHDDKDDNHRDNYRDNEKQKENSRR